MFIEHRELSDASQGKTRQRVRVNRWRDKCGRALHTYEGQSVSGLPLRLIHKAVSQRGTRMQTENQRFVRCRAPSKGQVD
jgi:hypothetical protein